MGVNSDEKRNQAHSGNNVQNLLWDLGWISTIVSPVLRHRKDLFQSLKYAIFQMEHKVEEYYSSDLGFHGDGYRIIKLSCKNDKVCGSVFDFSSSNYSPRSIHDDDLRVIDTTCSKLLSTQGNKEDFLPSNHTLLVKTLKQFDNTLVIVYSTEDDLYYLFEELI